MLLTIVVFNFILLVILIHCYRAVIPQPVVDTIFIIIIITGEISLRANSEIRTSETFLFVYVFFDDMSGTRNTKISRPSPGHERGT